MYSKRASNHSNSIGIVHVFSAARQVISEWFRESDRFLSRLCDPVRNGGLMPALIRSLYGVSLGSMDSMG
ncbi:Protein of unknown function [Pyronema omphalodes CBS 100304]|uniref:Uncharacterized protein n=1 Tax=Pyronema omphalodes (strain CBS 100304) TaxID=1076935 RepID=U4L9U9_PYROM|nr:Protein of unknown function [Pyronema omphalodes CBS 100304]